MVAKIRWIKKGIAKQRVSDPQMAVARKLQFRAIWLTRLLQGEDEPHKLLGGVGYGDIVMLTLGAFLR